MSLREKEDQSLVHLESGIAEADERWALALRVAESKEFVKSPRLRDFLLYVCRNALTDHTDAIHEQQIGLAVFGRRADYNPAEDNIVRVEARELRKRLDRYFAGEGAAEPVRIVIPKGSYVPVFEPQSVEPLTKESRTALAQHIPPIPAPSATILEAHARRRVPPAWLTAMGVIFVIAALLVVVHRRSAGGRPVASPSVALARAGAPATGIWSLLFPPHSTLNLVVADSALVVVEDITRHAVPLKDYSSRKYLDHLPSIAAMIASRPYTDLADVMVTSRILEALEPQGQRIVIRYPRDLTIRNLESDNTIFLGSAYSDPWIDEFGAQANFTVDRDQATGRLCFLNKTPRPGEFARYCAGAESWKTTDTYGLVTFLPNLQHTGNILILEGTTGAGTEAAGDFVTNPHYAANLPRYLSLRSKPATLPYFQLLLRTPVLDNTPGALRVIAHRIIAGGAPR